MRTLLTLGQGYGNVIMATPLIRALAAMHHEIDVLCECNWPDAWQLIADHPCVHRTIKHRAELPLDVQNYDLLVRTVWHRQPYGFSHEVFPERLDIRTHHESVINLTVARALGFTGKNPPPFVAASLHRATVAPQKSTDIIIADPAPVSPFWRRKRYPHFAEVAARLIAAGRAVTLIGCPQDEKLWYAYPAAARRIIPPDIAAAAQYLATARAFIGPDCGLAHIAAALNRPTFAIFGPTSDIKNRPLGEHVHVLAQPLKCRPCQMTARWEACDDFRCLHEMPPAEVAETILALLPADAKVN